MQDFDALNAEAALDKFNEKLSGLSRDEIEQWLHHECTVALLWGLLHSELAYLEMWREGGFTTESAYGTAQKNAEALGAIKALGYVKQYITEEIGQYDNSNRS